MHSDFYRWFVNSDLPQTYMDLCYRAWLAGRIYELDTRVDQWSEYVKGVPREVVKS